MGLTSIAWIYLWASSTLLLFGIHAILFSETPPELGPEGPAQNVENLLGMDVSDVPLLRYIPGFDDWQNVVEPELQYWPLRNEWVKQ